MYEVRKQKQKELREKNWFYYAILAAGIFLFSEGCVAQSTGYAVSAILIGIILHSVSVGILFEKNFKIKPFRAVNIAMVILLVVIALTCYFADLKFILVLILDLASIVLYTAVSLIYSKLKNRQE